MSAITKGPPAIWTAFAQQARWKNWVLVGQLVLILVLVVMCVALAEKKPEVIVVAADGNSTFIDQTVSGAALTNYLREQKNKASDVTVLAFTQRFVKLTSGINSTTIDESWAEALTMMMQPLADRLGREAIAQKTNETYRLAMLKMAVEFSSVELVERRADKAHVKAKITRLKEKLTGGGNSQDALQIDLVLVDVPRNREHPDGLAVLDWRSSAISETPDSGVQPQ